MRTTTSTTTSPADDEPLLVAHMEYDRLKRKRRRGILSCLFFFAVAVVVGTDALDRGDSFGLLFGGAALLVSLADAASFKRSGRRMGLIKAELASCGRKP